MANKILTGDEVIVIRGRNKGEIGRVRQNLIREDKVVVEGVNIVRKHLPRDETRRRGGIIEVEAPLYKSKVMVICPSCSSPTRIGFRFDDDGNKYRFCKVCEEEIPHNRE